MKNINFKNLTDHKYTRYISKFCHTIKMSKNKGHISKSRSRQGDKKVEDSHGHDKNGIKLSSLNR